MKKKNIGISKLFIIIVLLAISQVSCKKFVEVGAPVTQANGENVYTSDATAIAVLTGMYSSIAQGSPSPNFVSGTSSISLRAGLSADEFTLFTGANTTLAAFYKNALISNQTVGFGTDFWNVFFNYIYFANSAIEGLNSSKTLTDKVKHQLLGEAKFMRAFFYFYLVNMYGEVPLVTTTDYKVNMNLSRSSVKDVYQLIIKDLNEALEMLSTEYLDGNLQKYSGGEERVRPTKWGAAALLARAYLYNGNLTGDASSYANAETQASSVISNTSLFDTTALNSVFLKNSEEAIWQIQPVKTNQNTEDSKMFIVTTGFNNSTPVRLSDTLLSSFEPGDFRKVSGNWVKTVVISGKTYYYPFKYKNNTGNVTEYIMVLRLAEQYLIRAEARIQQNKIVEGRNDLNVIRRRAGLSNNTLNNKSELLSMILHERQVELFSEWGHRWFDLKRTSSIDPLMTVITPLKANGAPWQSYQQLYPLPYSEILQNPNLKQNPNY